MSENFRTVSGANYIDNPGCDFSTADLFLAELTAPRYQHLAKEIFFYDSPLILLGCSSINGLILPNADIRECFRLNARFLF